LAEQWARVLPSHHAYAQRDETESLGMHIVDLVKEQTTQGFQSLIQTISCENADQVERDRNPFKNGLGADVTVLED
jgi:hypothetical protein